MKRYLKDDEVKDGLKSSAPIILGYVPIAITFGLISKESGVSLIDSIIISATVYAGASQFMGLNLLMAGAGTIEILITTFLINFRFFLTGTAFINRLKEDLGKWSLIVGHTLTDETFSVSFIRKKKLTRKYILALNIPSYLSWIIGTLIGHYFGSILPKIVTESMGIALYAMFIAILVPEIKRSKRTASLIFLSVILNTVFTSIKSLPQGWNIILAIIISSSIGATIFKDDMKGDVHDE